MLPLLQAEHSVAEVRRQLASLFSETLDCFICNEQMSQPHMCVLHYFNESLAHSRNRIPHCGHSSCGTCINKWFTSCHSISQPLTCPACRVHVTVRPIPDFALKRVLELLGEDNSTPVHDLFGNLPLTTL